MPIIRLLEANGGLPYFAAAMLLGALANACFFFVLWRMKNAGRRVRIWRTGKDLELYRDYWRVAPLRKWSRAPLVLGPVSFLFACWLMLMSLRGIRIPE